MTPSWPSGFQSFVVTPVDAFPTALGATHQALCKFNFPFLIFPEEQAESNGITASQKVSSLRLKSSAVLLTEL